MTDHNPGESNLAEFDETAERSQAAGIADESASYVNAAKAEDARGERQDAQVIPQTGEENPLAEMSAGEPVGGQPISPG